MKSIADLCVAIKPLKPESRISDVGELFLNPDYYSFLSLPIVENGRTVGTISRHQIQQNLMSRFGRDIQGNKPISLFMNPAPLIVDINQSMSKASQYLTKNIALPVTEDFVVTDGDDYSGMGSVVGLIRGLESQLIKKNVSLTRAYDKLKSSQAQLVQSEKMASLGQMVAGVAHEINTPLGYVQNNVEMAREAYNRLAELNLAYDELFTLIQMPSADEQVVDAQFSRVLSMRESFANIYTQKEMEGLFSDSLFGLQHISKIVINLKNFSRLDQAPVDNIDLNECLISALLIGNNVIKHKADVIRNFGELPKVSCSPSQVNQVFLNLLTNAAQAIEDRGRIVIKTQADDRFVHVVIQDNGKGISPDNLKNIFDPFYTTKSIGEGTGLGLSIVFGIVKDHHGHIQVKSELGRGTAFCVSLPIQHVLN